MKALDSPLRSPVVWRPVYSKRAADLPGVREKFSTEQQAGYVLSETVRRNLEPPLGAKPVTHRGNTGRSVMDR